MKRDDLLVLDPGDFPGARILSFVLFLDSRYVQLLDGAAFLFDVEPVPVRTCTYEEIMDIIA